MKKKVKPSTDGVKQNNSAKKGFIAFIMLFIAVISFIGGYFFSTLTKDPDVRTVEWVVDTIKKHGYYFDEDTGEVRKITGEQIADSIVKGFLDKYSEYYTAEEYTDVVATNKGNVYGFGLSFLKDTTDLNVFRTTGNSPAFYAGIKKGDTIVGGKKIGEERVDFLLREDFSNFSAPIPANEEFTLYVLRDGTELSFTISKQAFISSYVTYYDNKTMGTFVSNGKDGLKFITSSSQEMQNLPDNTAYIRYDAFSGQSVFEIKTVMAYIKERQMTGIILDLRDNGGGRMTILSEVASYFVKTDVKKPVIAYVEESDGRLTHYNASGNNFVNSVQKITVIANKNTASASECLIGAMMHYGEVFSRDNLIIERGYGADGSTYGKGIMQSTFIHPLTGEALKITVAKVYLPDRVSSIHGRGFWTNVENAVLPENALSRAIEIMNG